MKKTKEPQICTCNHLKQVHYGPELTYIYWLLGSSITGDKCLCIGYKPNFETIISNLS